ncbi:cupin domain-containing protein [Kitasatospora sp. NPDC090308]|uniref:cupin domain-containing protein n=1 Tax=Kitasatospora sp. NPDC090308 TaxID=3364082 RepID=UPI0038284FE8
MTPPEHPHHAPRPLRDAMRPHPEGGRHRVIWESGQPVHPLDHRSERAAGTAIQYLLDPGEGAAWHRVDSDELWIWQDGGPAHLLTADAPPGAPGHRPTAHRLGPDGDHRPWDGMHRLVPAGTWQSTRLLEPVYALFVCVVAPGFDTRDYTLLPTRRADPPDGPS